MLAVVRGDSAEAATASARIARESLEQKGCELFGVFVNRVPVADMPAVVEQLAAERTAPPVYVLPEQPELAYPVASARRRRRRSVPSRSSSRTDEDCLQSRRARCADRRDERRALHRRPRRRHARDRSGRPLRHPHRQPHLDALVGGPGRRGRRDHRGLRAATRPSGGCSKTRRSRAGGRRAHLCGRGHGPVGPAGARTRRRAQDRGRARRVRVGRRRATSSRSRSTSSGPLA